MPKNGNVPATVVMTCLHTFTAYIRPRQGDVLYCSKCKEYKEWTSAVFNVSLHCNRCQKLKGRGFGGQIQAEASAIRHALKYRDHEVKVIINGVSTSTHLHGSDVSILETETPPF